jgi:ATP-dependent Clp protease adaptor protein ClpS
MNQEQSNELVDNISKKSNLHYLVLHNDDFNTFDHVIESLVTVCHHTPEQAEQCAMIVHYKGRYEVKSGSYKTLSPLKTELIDRLLTATIE